MAKIIEKIQKPTLVIAHNKTLAAQLCSEFQSFFPENAVNYFVSYYDYYQPEAYLPANDTFIEKEATINDEINRFRHAATHNLLTRKDVLIVASVSCIYGLGSVQDYQDLAIEININETIKRDKFLRKLSDIQFLRAHLDFKPGMFSVFGDTVDIFPPSSNDVFRIEFFGDEIEKISRVNPFTGEFFEELQSIKIFPAKHDITTNEKIANAEKEIAKDLAVRVAELKKSDRNLEAHRLKTRTEYDLEVLRETGYVNGIENYTRYLSGRKSGEPPPTLLEYFPDDFITFVDESHITIPQVGAMFEGNLSRKKQLIEYGFRLSSCRDNRPLKFTEFENFVPQMVCVSATPGKYEFEKCAKISKENFYKISAQKILNNEKIEMPKNFTEQIIRPTGLLDPKIEILPTKDQIKTTLQEIKKRKKNNERVLITTLTKKSAEKLTSFLSESGILVKYLHSDVDTLERIEILRELREGKIDSIVGINLLREGLDLPEVSLVVILDADKRGFLRSRDALIQTMGRAARNENGKVLLFADEKTPAMIEAISETSRRRKIQNDFNKKYNIIPKTIKKEIRDISPGGKNKLVEQIKKVKSDKVPEMIRELEQKMEIASQNLEFEKAAELRDEIDFLKAKDSAT